MRFAYADPPYYGCAVKLYGDHPEAAVYDTLAGHQALIDRLMAEYPDGWALSMTSGNLRDLLPLCPRDVRIASWVKPFAAFKRNVRVAYTWEPVVFYGGRLSSKDGATPCRDHIAESITMRKGLTGAKPERFCAWVLGLLGYIPGDQVDDIFPGTGVMGRVVTLLEGRDLPGQDSLFGDDAGDGATDKAHPPGCECTEPWPRMGVVASD